MKHKLLTIAGCWFLVFCSTEAYNQQSDYKPKLFIESKIHYGFIIPHHQFMLHLSSTHFTMFEIGIAQQTNGVKQWERNHRYPVKGINFLYSDLGGAKYLGKAYGIFPYLNFKSIRGKNLNLHTKIGLGIGYLSKCFKKTTNYQNVAIGSHFNALIQIGSELRWRTSNRLITSAGLSITHMSNGAIKMPNRGINIISLDLGINWKLSSLIPEIIKNDTSRAFDKKWEYTIIGFYGCSEMNPALGDKYYAGGIASTILKPVNIKYKIGPGIDITYDEANIEALRRNDIESKNKTSAITCGTNFSYRADFSRINILFQLGYYIYTKYKGNGAIYNRVAIQYKANKYIIAHLGLKTHFFTADMIEFGLGYRFN